MASHRLSLAVDVLYTWEILWMPLRDMMWRRGFGFLPFNHELPTAKATPLFLAIIAA